MFIASRYLATVRRATSMPRSLRISARRASLSGLSSCSISLRISARMAVPEVASPSAVARLDEKKYFSS